MSETQKALLEAILFQAREPLPAERIARALNESPGDTEALLASFAADLESSHRGLLMRNVAGGFQLMVKPEHLETIRSRGGILKPRPPLSPAALETLALIAYSQPVTASDILSTRGVQTAGVLQTLLERKLIAAAGRKKAPGNPVLYRTTRLFLIEFGMRDLGDLPALEEFKPKEATG